MKINLVRKARAGIVWAPIIIAVIIGVATGVVANWIWSNISASTYEKCAEFFTSSSNVINNTSAMSQAQKDAAIKTITGIYLCCIQGKGTDYIWDSVTSKCVSTSSVSG